MSPLDELTPRQVFIMAKAKQFDSWNHTSMLCCVLSKVFGGDKKITPNDFHPFTEKRKSNTVDDLFRFVEQTRGSRKNG